MLNWEKCCQKRDVEWYIEGKAIGRESCLRPRLSEVLIHYLLKDCVNFWGLEDRLENSCYKIFYVHVLRRQGFLIATKR